MPRASQLYKFIYTNSLLLVLLLLNGCATLKPKDITTTETLSQLTVFQVNGRLAIIQPQQKQSAYFYMQQNNQEYKLTVNTFLGINLFTAQRDSQGIIIETNEQKYVSSQPQQLLFELTGWWLPLDELHAWLKADLKSSQGAITFYESDNNSPLTQANIKSFKPSCQQLYCPNRVTITYNKYQAVGKLVLPFSITIDVAGEQEQSIRIKIKEWL